MGGYINKATGVKPFNATCGAKQKNKKTKTKKNCGRACPLKAMEGDIIFKPCFQSAKISNKKRIKFAERL